MSPKTFSLKNRLLAMIIGCIAIIWIGTSILVWFDAKSELEEVFHKIIEHHISIDQLTHEKDELLSDLLWGLIWPLIIGLPILTVIVYSVVNWVSSSILVLQRAIFDRKPESLELIEISGLPEEISPLVDELNGLLSKVKKSLEHEKRFTADAAHELRTPLAAIKAQAEVIKLEKEINEEALDNLIEGCDRASRLIEQLLALSRVETSKEAFDHSIISISDFVRKQIANVYPEVELKHQQIQFVEEGTYQVNANEALLSIVVRNLLDNAIRYSPSDSQIDVSVNQKNGHVYLSIEDGGTGLTGDQISQLGVRFQRIGQTDSSGSGLGWSIIKKIAEIENFAISVAKGPQWGGLLVSIKFPS
jgi:two-component system, OmpR family, sensor histidine kinase QseC